MIEISAVAVPANTDALVRMLEAAQGPAAPTEDELAERKALDKIIAGLPAEIGAFERQIEGTLGELRELIVGLLPGTAVESPAEEDPPRGADRRASAAGEDGDPLRRSAAALRRAIGH